MNSKDLIELSIIVPLFNEEESVDLLYQKIKRAVEETERVYELIFVDDGSSDSTVERVSNLAKNDPWAAFVSLR